MHLCNVCTHCHCAGFVLNGRYQAQSTIKRVLYHEENDNFVSLDQLGLQLWKVNACSAAAVCLKRLPFPRTHFVTCMLFIPGPKLVACACLDGCLRLYKYDLRLKSTLPWGETAVSDMHYIKPSNELIVAGTQGIKVRLKPASIGFNYLLCRVLGSMCAWQDCYD